jgi:hypothetical protein
MARRKVSRCTEDRVYHGNERPFLVSGSWFLVIDNSGTSNQKPETRKSIWTTSSLLSAFSAALSNLASNVPAVLFKPFDAHLANPRRVWLTLAMSSTPAGNLTVLGSVANLIVIQQARRKVTISFWEYFRVGRPTSYPDHPLRRNLDSNTSTVGQASGLPILTSRRLVLNAVQTFPL